MRNANKLQRAAMGALVAAALMAGAGQASARVYRFPADGPSKLPDTRVRIMDDGSGGMFGRLRLMLAFVRVPREAGWEGIGALRLPARIMPRTN